MYCDLHMHSTASDGTDAPEALARLAKEVGLEAIALTDHDTTAGLLACEQACRDAGISFVPGIEISADPTPVPDGAFRCRGTLHILGLFVDRDDSELAKISATMQAARDERNPAIVDKLREHGLDIHYNEVQKLAADQGTAVIGRPHIGQVLIDKGIVADMGEAFEQYIGRSGAAYTRRDRLHPKDAIAAIHHAGGLAILAHPIQLGLREPGQVESFIANLKDLGLDGMEVFHSDHGKQHIRHYQSIASDLNLLVSGGSDYHGTRKPVEIGSQGISLDVYRALLEALPTRNG